MGYEVLYRRWRSKGFDELVGQDHVRRALSHALDSKRLHHAYLFTGTRGVGKTTVARIFSRCLSCETGIGPAPCGECSICREILEGRFVDLIEVDAASRTGVDDTRELLENLQYAPVRGRYKIYLIDEVHMLSTHSFNALLKSLEEPPPWVIFLLATTEPKKLPVTVLSRCLQFALKSFSPPVIARHLSHVLTEEAINFEADAVNLLARSARGSMRDALSLTDQAIVHGSGQLTAASVAALLGTLNQDTISELADAIINADPRQVLAASSAIEEAGGDFEEALTALIELLHQSAVAQALATTATDPAAAKLAAALSPDDLQLLYQFAIMGSRDLNIAPEPKLGFEMTLLRMLAFAPLDANNTSRGRAPTQEQRAATPPSRVVKPNAAKTNAGKPSVGMPSVGMPSVGMPKPEGPSNREITPTSLSTPVTSKRQERPDMPRAAASSSQPLVSAQVQQRDPDSPLRKPQEDLWDQWVERMTLGGAARELAWNCALIAFDEPRLSLVLHEAQRTLLNDERIAQIKRSLSDLLGKAIEVQIAVTPHTQATPASKRTEAARARHLEAVSYLREHPQVQSLIDRFGGRLDESSVKP